MIAQAPGQDKLDFRVMGIDSACRKSGVCLLGSGGAELTLIDIKKERGVDRLLSIRERIRELLGDFAPDIVVLEGYSYGSAGRWFDLGEVGGMVKLEVADAGAELLIVPPSLVKKFATGNGMSRKELMIKAVSAKYGIETQDDNLADSAVLAQIGWVYHFEESIYRSELDTVFKLKNPAPKRPRRKFKTNKMAI